MSRANSFARGSSSSSNPAPWPVPPHRERSMVDVAPGTDDDVSPRPSPRITPKGSFVPLRISSRTDNASGHTSPSKGDSANASYHDFEQQSVGMAPKQETSVGSVAAAKGRISLGSAVSVRRNQLFDDGHAKDASQAASSSLSGEDSITSFTLEPETSATLSPRTSRSRLAPPEARRAQSSSLGAVPSSPGAAPPSPLRGNPQDARRSPATSATHTAGASAGGGTESPGSSSPPVTPSRQHHLFPPAGLRLGSITSQCHDPHDEEELVVSRTPSTLSARPYSSPPFLNSPSRRNISRMGMPDSIGEGPSGGYEDGGPSQRMRRMSAHPSVSMARDDLDGSRGGSFIGGGANSIRDFFLEDEARSRRGSANSSFTSVSRRGTGVRGGPGSGRGTDGGGDEGAVALAAAGGSGGGAPSPSRDKVLLLGNGGGGGEAASNALPAGDFVTRVDSMSHLDPVGRIGSRLRITVSPSFDENGGGNNSSRGSKKQPGWESNAPSPGYQAVDEFTEVQELGEPAGAAAASRQRPAGVSHPQPHGPSHEWSAQVLERVKAGTVTADVFLRRAPPNDLVRCHVLRTKSFLGGASMYQLFLSDSDTFLLAARKRVRTSTSVFVISKSSEDLHRDSEHCLARLTSNFLGTEYELHGRVRPDAGVAPKKEFGQNLMGLYFKQTTLHLKGGPRVMQVAVRQSGGSSAVGAEAPDSLVRRLELARKREMTPAMEADVVLMATRPPFYNPTTKAYTLDFGTRVRASSVKNFQLVSWDHNSDEMGTRTMLQFGKVAKDTFILDFSHPFNLHSAFAVALASFDSKLAYAF